MSVTPQRYESLKRKIEQDRKEADQAEGALAQVMRDIRKEFDRKDLKSAEKLHRAELDALERDEEALEAKVEELEARYHDAR